MFVHSEARKYSHKNPDLGFGTRSSLFLLLVCYEAGVLWRISCEVLREKGYRSFHAHSSYIWATKFSYPSSVGTSARGSLD